MYKTQSWRTWQTASLKTFNGSVKVYQPSVYREYRGEIWTTYHNLYHPAATELAEMKNSHVRFSRSYQGVLRGLHWDMQTYKLVQALVGDIYLIVLDMDPARKTYGLWESYILSEKTRDQVLVPPGYANGHYALTDCCFHYQLFYPGDYVDESQQKVVKWNDKRFNIEWPTNNPILQERDR